MMFSVRNYVGVVFALGLACCRVVPVRAQTADDLAREANERRVAKAATKIVKDARKRRSSRVNLEDHYYGLGASYIIAPGNDAPYRSGVSLRVVSGYPILQNKVVLEPFFNLDCVFMPNMAWFGGATGVPADYADAPAVNFRNDFGAGVYYTVLNKKKVSLTAGPACGLTSSFAGLDVGYGCNATLYLAQSIMICLQYNYVDRQAIERPFGPYPVSLQLFRIGVLIRRSDFRLF